MNRGAILHIPLSQYAYASDERTLVIRLRAARDDLRRCELYYGDRVDPEEPIPVKRQAMERVASDDVYDYFETVIRDHYTRVCYYFLLWDGGESCFYYERGLCPRLDCGRAEYFQFPYIRREDVPDIPAWAQAVRMYHIFPDSFASGRRELSGKGGELTLPGGITVRNKLGGTLAGVRQNLDYIAGMGFNCIYLNPIFLANSYHKYDTIDYFEIDPLFGTKQELRELVTDCHSRGVRVILDGVFNHCGSDFFAFRDVRKKGKESRYYDWFYSLPEEIRYEDPPNYEAFAYVKEMPKLNTGNPRVAEYFCQVGTYWIREADIDGWRLDVANEVDHDFWRRFRRSVRAVKQDVFLIGEIWENAEIWLKGDQFDSTMNYTFSYLCRDFFGQERMSVTGFDGQIHRMLLRYPHTVSNVQMNFLDSHDVSRFLSACGGKRERLRLALFYLFMCVGIPSVFYGDERYLAGETEPEYRRGMRWDGPERPEEEETSGAENIRRQDDLTELLARWSALREEHPALHRGSYRTVRTDDAAGVYGFLRKTEEETLLILLNNGTEDVTVELREEEWEHALPEGEWTLIYGAESGALPAKEGSVYLLAKDL